MEQNEAAGYSAISQSTVLPALAGFLTVPAAAGAPQDHGPDSFRAVYRTASGRVPPWAMPVRIAVILVLVGIVLGLALGLALASAVISATDAAALRM